MSQVSAEASPGQKGGAPQDSLTAKAPDVGVKAIGLAATPYESLRQKVLTGNATKEEAALLAQITPEKYIDAGTIFGGNSAVSGNSVSTIPGPSDGTKGRVREEEQEEEEEDPKKSAEELMAGYGYTKERLEKDFQWSTLNKSEQKRTFEMVRKFLREQRIKGVKDPGSVSNERTSRMAPLSSPAGTYVVNGIDLGFPDMEKHLENYYIPESATSGEYKHLWTKVPFLRPPRVERGNGAADGQLDFSGVKKRLAWVNVIEGYSDYRRELLTEAVATTTSGAAMGIQANSPAMIVPQNLSALLRDTVYFQQVMQGYNIARFQTVTVPSAVSLVENTEPAQASQTFKTVDIQPSPRGVEQQISFEAERKIMGNVLETVILSFRLSELYDEDYLLIGGPNTSNVTTPGNQAFELGVVTTGTNVQGATTGNQQFGNARASEATVIAADTMSVQFLDDAVNQIQNQGYGMDNLVTVMFPQQYRKLLIDANAIRMVSFGPNTDNSRSMLAQGVIPELIGSELRRSTLGNTGTGSSSITTYHAWMYKKGLTVCLAASRDVMIETFRDIRTNAMWVKGHWDLKANLLHPNSLVELVTA